MNIDCNKNPGPCSCGAWHKKEEFLVQDLKLAIMMIQLNADILQDYGQCTLPALKKIQEIAKKAMEKIDDLQKV